MTHVSMHIDTILTGMHRSGTTWLGEMVARAKEYGVVHEPFNYDHGLVGTPAWYLDPNEADHIGFLRAGFEKIEAESVKFKWRFNATHPLKSIVSRFLGTGVSRHYKRTIVAKPPRLAIKDPFLLKMAPKLADDGKKVVVSVRHPGAIMLSLQRMKWPTEISGKGVSEAHRKDNRLSEIAKSCALWSDLYRATLDYVDRANGDFLFIADHSTIFRNVTQFGPALLEFLDVREGRSEALKFLTESTSGATVTPNHRKLHDFSRDSRKLAEAWRSEYSMQELDLFEDLVGASTAKFAAASKADIERFTV